MFRLAWFFGVDDLLMIVALLWVRRKALYKFGEVYRYCWHYIAWGSQEMAATGNGARLGGIFRCLLSTHKWFCPLKITSN